MKLNRIVGVLAVAIISCAVSSCSIDMAEDYGELCDEAAVTQTSLGTLCVSPESCNENEIAAPLSNKHCPSHLPRCVKNSRGSYCRKNETGVVCSDYQNGIFNKLVSDPNQSTEFCGAKGMCIDDDKNTNNYKGSRCGEDQFCEGGQCKYKGNTCGNGTHPDPQDTSSCVPDLSTACGKDELICAENQICSNGKCVDECPTTESKCTPPGQERPVCIDFSKNQLYCGVQSCEDMTEDSACSSDEECVNSDCQPKSCESKNQLLCRINGKKQCIDGQININHCGQCDNDCTKLTSNGTATSNECLEGKCQFVCNANLTNCGSADTPLCVNTQIDSLHCGDCSTVCDQNKNESCISGICVQSSCDGNQCFADGSCINEDNKCGTSCIDCNTYNNATSGQCDNGSCKATACGQGYHVYNDLCDPDSDDKCGQAMINCTQTNQVCIVGKCITTKCSGNQCFTDGSCVNEDNKCGTSCIDCNTYNNATSGQCDNDSCKATACGQGYHVYNDLCERDSDDKCGQAMTDCTQTNQICSAGECITTQCVGNQCFTNGTCVNEDIKCGTSCINCNTYDNATSGQCDNGSCKATACGQGYHLNNGICKPNTVNDCGSPGLKCNVANADNQCVVGACKFTCHSGFTMSGNACVEETTTNCGSKDCTTNIPGWIDGKCLNGACHVTQCKSQMHVNGFACEADTDTKCGNKLSNCETSFPNGKGICDTGVCKLSTCDINYHKDGESCKPDSVNACGAPTTKCTVSNGTPKCDKGKCVVGSCATDYHPNSANTNCEKDSIYACGSASNDCTKNSGWGGGKCTNGECIVTSCKDSTTFDYTLYNGVCIRKCYRCSTPDGVIDFSQCCAKRDTASGSCDDKKSMCRQLFYGTGSGYDGLDHCKFDIYCEEGTCSTPSSFNCFQLTY